MLTEMPVTLFTRNLLATDIAHSVPAIAYQFVAAGGFDEAEDAFRTGALHCCCGGGFDRRAQGGLLGFEAYVWISPDGLAAHTGGSAARGSLALELEAAPEFVDSAP